MSDLQDALDGIRERLEKATEGPWDVQGGWGGHEVIVDEPEPGDMIVAERLRQGYDEGYSDAEFIAAARTDVPRLLAAVEAVLELLKEPEEWHVYDTRDMGEAYDADTVKDFIGDVREALTDKLTGEIEHE